MMNYNYCYTILNIPENSSIDEIKSAYKKMIKENHPDKFQNEKRKKIQELKTTQIIDAYHKLIKSRKDRPVFEEKSNTVNDNKSIYSIYRQAMDCFDESHRLFHSKTSYINGRWVMEKDNFEKKVQSISASILKLREAERLFLDITQNYSQSEWSHDSREKMIQINKLYSYYHTAIENLKKEI